MPNRTLSGLLFVLVVLSIPPHLMAQQPSPEDSSVRAARSFVESLRRGDFAAASRRAAASLTPGALSAERLEGAWTQITWQHGELRELSPLQVSVSDTLRMVDLAGRFSTGQLTIRVVLNPHEEVAGLWFRPGGPTLYVPPSYVDTAAFAEAEVSLGEEPWRLQGTLSLPHGEGPFPAVVLVHGSGPHDRDETIGGHRPFRDLAWGLASRGIAVLRYEKRTHAYPGRAAEGGITVDEEVVDDAVAAVALLRERPEVDPARLFVLGHSLGAALAPEIAERAGAIAGVVLMAAPARPMNAVLRDQLVYLRSIATIDAERAQLEEMLRQVEELDAGTLPPDSVVLGAPGSYYRDLARRDPVATARRLDTRVLVLHGGRDYQVTEADFALWRAAFDASERATLKEYANLDHLFVAGEGRATPAEYLQGSGHVAAEVIRAIAAWIKQ